jgi:uncharacterized protein (UPF0332 family)
MKEEARKFLKKADRALHAAETLLRAGDYESATGRAYYALLHAAQALLRESDLRYRKHAGVHTAFGEHFIKTGRMDVKYHRWLLDAFDDRLRADYDVEAPFEGPAAAGRIEQAREFLATVKKYLESST